MNLSDEVYSRICGALGVAADDTSTFWRGAEGGGGAAKQPRGPRAAAPCEVVCRREAERLDLSLDVDFEPHNSTMKRRRVALRNFSNAGAALVDDRPSRFGETIVLHLPFGPDRTVPVLCRVQNSRILSGGRFRIGVRFIAWAEADPGTLAAVAGQAAAERQAAEREAGEPRDASPPVVENQANAHAGARDRRAGRRRLRSRAEFHTYDRGGAGPRVEAVLVDVSPRGLGLVCETALEVGQKFVARYWAGEGRPSVQLCVVAHCRALDEGFRIGANFLPASDEKFGQGVLEMLPAWFA